MYFTALEFTHWKFTVILRFIRLFWLQTLHDCEEVLSHHNVEDRKNPIPPTVVSCISKFNEEVLLSMLDDLHTPVSVSALSEPLKTINDLIHTRKVLILDDRY